MIYFNPASVLAANRIPYALGAGRLADGPVFDPSSAVSLRVVAANPGAVAIGVSTLPLIQGYTSSAATTSEHLALQVNAGKDLLVGTQTASANGKVQLATHTTQAGGVGLGTDTGIFRAAADTLKLTGNSASTSAHFIANGLYGPEGNLHVMLSTNAGVFADQTSILGWQTPTGTFTKTTFDTATVTLPQLAERVAALIRAFRGVNGHRLLGD